MAQKDINQNLGIKLYIEEPEVVIRREIRRSIWIVAAVLIIASIFITLAVYRIKQMTPGLTAKQNTIYSTLQSNVVEGNLLNNWEETKPILEKINQALPDPTNLLAYQAALEKAGADAGLQIAVNFSGTSVGSASKISGTSVIEHQVQAKGEIDSINQFLTNVEKMPYYVELAKFTITPASGTKKETSASLTFKLYAAKTASTENIPGALPTTDNLEIR